jgi:nucleoside-diphosphate-sugar epimerase
VGQIFNIATGQESSVNQLISIIDKLSGKKNEVIYADFRVGEVKHSRANIAKAQKILGYNPEVNLEEGLRLTWEAEMAGKY